MFDFFRNLFGYAASEIEQKFSVVYAKIAQFTAQTERRAGINYDDFAKEGYFSNPIVRKAIDLKASNVADMKWKLFEQKPDGTLEEISQHALLDLLERPNPAQTKEAFWQQAMIFFDHGGSIFLHAVGPGDKQDTQGSNTGNERIYIERRRNAPPPKEIYTYRPDSVEIVPSKFGMIAAFKVRGSNTMLGGGTTVIRVNPLTGEGAMHHIKGTNPLDGTPFGIGASPVQAIAFNIDQWNEAVKWNTNALQHSVDPGGWWKHVGDEPLDPESFYEAKQAISEMMSGPTNAKRTLVVDQWEYTPFSNAAKDMDWMEMINGAARNIALGLGVPPQILGIPGDNTYSNLKEANFAFWTQTIVPIINRLTSELNKWLVPMFSTEGQKLILKPDMNEIHALAPIRREKWETVAGADFLTINEKRAELGFEAIDAAEADQVMIPSNVLPINFDSETMNDVKAALELDGYSSRNAERLAIKLIEYAQKSPEEQAKAPDFAVNDKGQLLIMNDETGVYESAYTD